MISHLSVGKHAVEASLFQSVMDNIFKHLKKVSYLHLSPVKHGHAPEDCSRLLD